DSVSLWQKTRHRTCERGTNVVLGFIALLWLSVQAFVAAQEYPVRGMVLSVDRASSSFTASIQEIPGFMRAMAMPFAVRHANDLDGLTPGAVVEFTLVADAASSHAERIRVVRYQSVEPDPLAASRLKMLTQIAGLPRRSASAKAGPAPRKALVAGEPVPDFRLTDQTRRAVALAGLRGKVVAVNFI